MLPSVTRKTDMTTQSSDRRPVVAVINSSPDAVDLLKDALEQAGLLVVTGFTHDIRDGKLDLPNFLATHQPDAIVYDIAPPYHRNWDFLQHLRSSVLGGFRFVLTSFNPERLLQLVGRDETVYEVVGKATDLGAIVQAAREAVRARATR
jgi:CheY-like chemotaxis protein